MDGIRHFPIVSLRDGVVFPHTEPTLSFGRAQSVAGIEAAIKSDKQLIFVAQKNDTITPIATDLYEIGTLCVVDQFAPVGNELLAKIKGISRVKIGPVSQTEPYFTAPIEILAESYLESDRTVATARQILMELRHLFDMGRSVDFPIFMRLMAGVSAAELADQVANMLDLKTPLKQKLLEILSVDERLDEALVHLAHEIKVVELEHNIAHQAQAKFDKNYKEQVLRERQKTISKELEKLGSETAGDEDDYAMLRKRIKASGMPDDIRKKSEKEVSRLKQMSFSNPESNYIRTYLEWLCDMPWKIASKNHVALSRAARILDEDHYGLSKVKERIMEYLSVMKLRNAQKSPDKDGITGTILCFVGPPGVGKTSIGKSIAKALGRKFVRISLGGIRDEAEIRGHRRTYVGALPGRIIQGIKTAGTKNPVFMLDELDKLASDYRGDPSSALLEALDPEQNNAFSDHYLEVPFDLSQAIFIATANNLDTIPSALRDRLEVIHFSGYTIEEKIKIAKNYIWTKNLAKAALPSSLKIEDTALKEIAQRYTREAGVRDLERNIAKICRKVARKIAEKKKFSPSTSLRISDVHKFLGPQRLPETLAETRDEIGMSTGLAWTQAGGDILFIEVAHMPGKGELQLTGQLGEVMKESAKAAFSYIRSRWDKLQLKENFYKELDIHIHVPEGAVPKDGPSAGIAIATAVISSLTDLPVRREVAMTGEITLRGRVLEIGGVKEKVIAAHRAGIKTVILPKDNEKDMVELPDAVKKDLKFHFVSHLDEVLKIALKLIPSDKMEPVQWPHRLTVRTSGSQPDNRSPILREVTASNAVYRI